MLSKPLIHFSVDRWSCVPSLLFSWGQTMLEVMKIMVTSLKRSHACTATVHALNPAVGHHQPMPETPGHQQARLGQSLVGSMLLSSGSWCTRFCCALQESISQCCVSSGSSMVGLMVTSSKRAYAILKSAAPSHTQVHCTQSPCPCSSPLPTHTSSGDTQTQTVAVSVGSLGPGVHKVCLSPLSVSGRYFLVSSSSNK